MSSGWLLARVEVSETGPSERCACRVEIRVFLLSPVWCLVCAGLGGSSVPPDSKSGLFLSGYFVIQTPSLSCPTLHTCEMELQQLKNLLRGPSSTLAGRGTHGMHQGFNQASLRRALCISFSSLQFNVLNGFSIFHILCSCEF